MNWVSGTFTVTCDPAKLDHAVIAEFLASSYWAKGIPPAVVEKSLAHSLCFILGWLMDCIVAHPELQGLRRWVLATSDAHRPVREIRLHATQAARNLHGAAQSQCL